MMVALGAGAAGVYTNSGELWDHLEKVRNLERKMLRSHESCKLHCTILFLQAAYTSGDRVWRMPLFELYKKQVQSDWADLINLGKKPQ
jgi:aminopeptidase